MTSMIKKILSLSLSAVIAASGLAVSASAATPDEAVTGADSYEAHTSAADDTIYVSRQSVNNSGFRYAVQSALNEAAGKATAKKPYTVVAPSGSYDLNGVLRLYSNTTLYLTGVKLKRSGSGNMLRVGDEDGENTGAVGYVYSNARLVGGTFDGNNGENTIIKAFHTKGFTMEGVTLLNEKEGHMTEFAGVDGLTVRGCTFKDQLLTPGNYGYEAIQLDVLHPFHITNGRCEDLPMTNVLIENCYFENVPRAIGSHTTVHNNPHNNITIRNNTFKNITSIAIQGLNWTNADITSNYIENAPRGITIYTEPGGCAYLSSKLASKGGTTSHVSDSYKAPAASNINIAYNTLKKIGTSDDKYASYSSQGIAVLGEKLTSKSSVDSDESGGLPAGDYYINGADIHDNYIDIRGNGVRVEDARDIKVRFNTIVCSKNTVHNDSGGYHGIKMKDNVTASAVSYNTIKSAEVNGIQIDDCTVNTIQYNRIENTGKYGVGIYDSIITNIYDNDIIGTKSIGLFMSNSLAEELQWNRIRNCSEEGIWITSDSKATLVKSNTTTGCSGSNVYGWSTVDSNYTSSKALTSFHIPWYFKTERAGATMGIGTAFKIVPDVRPTNAFASFTYTSSDSSVATVDSYGMVFAKKEGSTTIKVTSNNGISKSYPVTVTADGGVSHLEKKPSTPNILLGDIDSSGAVENTDATFLQRHIVYISTPYTRNTMMRGDVNKNGKLEITDVTFIQRYLIGASNPYGIGKKY